MIDNILEDIDEMLEIDPAHLDQELLKQSMHIGRIAILKKQAIMEKRLAHEKVKTIRSEIILNEKEENPSLTGQMLEAIYRTNKRYKKAKKKMIEAEYVEDMLDAIVDTLSHKQWALKDLVRLHGMEYFAGPNVPNDIVKNYESKRRSLVRRLVKTKLNKGRKKRRRT